MFSTRFVSASLPLLCAALAACGGGSGSNDAPAVDAGPAADANTNGQADAGTNTVACTVVPDFKDLGAIDGSVIADAENEYLSIDAVVNVGPPQDLYVIELFGGYGAMTDGLATGTFTLSGDETNYNTCGVCVSVLAEFDPMTGPTMTYIAQSGTVTITSVEGTFAGTFVPDGAGVPMTGAVLNEDSGMFDTRSDCTITGGGASWDKAIPAPAP